MTGRWMTQTAAAMLGVHLIVAVLIATVLVLLATRVHRYRIRRSQVLITRIALAAWPPPSALTSPEGGHAVPGADAPDPAPGTARRVHIEVGGPGRHRAAA